MVEFILLLQPQETEVHKRSGEGPRKKNNSAGFYHRKNPPLDKMFSNWQSKNKTNNFFPFSNIDTHTHKQARAMIINCFNLQKGAQFGND